MAEPTIVIAPVASLAERCAGLVRECASAGMARAGRWSLAISGGSIGERLLPSLVRREDIPWESCDVFWVDERGGAATSPDSNYGGVRALWAGHAPTATLHPIPAELPDLAIAATLYAGELRRVLGDAPRFDVVVAGIGEDGHIASLFPDRDERRQSEGLTLYVPDSPKPPPRRITVTFPMLTGAGHVVIAAFGSGKAPAVARALREPRGTLPVARVIHGSARATLLLDPDAASALTSPSEG